MFSFSSRSVFCSIRRFPFQQYTRFISKKQEKFIRNLSSQEIEKAKQLRMKEVKSINPITPKTKHIATNNFKELFTPELIKLSDLFKQSGYEIRIAGGAVRDLLMGKKPVDVDFASDATPQQMIDMFTKENIRMLHKKGEEHGTITCRINDKENFEITTLRIDVICDGRRAEVQFTTNWQLDAFRRDLTINSLFLKLDGTVVDYTNGIEDLENRRVVFSGDAEKRIQEDFLRILRYFRFYGRIADKPNDFDPNILDSIKRNAYGLGDISGERIWTELKKIAVGRFASPVMKVMLEECKLNKYLGIPENCSLDHFEKVVTLNDINDLMPATSISALFSNNDDLMRFHKRCKISNAEKGLCEIIINSRDYLEEKLNDDSVDKFKVWKDLLIQEYYKNCMKIEAAAKERVRQLGMYMLCDSKMLNEIGLIEIPRFPVDGIILKNNNFPKGPAVKFILDNCFTEWIKSDYTMSLEDLLAYGKKLEIPEEVTNSHLYKKKNKKNRSRCNSNS